MSENTPPPRRPAQKPSRPAAARYHGCSNVSNPRWRGSTGNISIADLGGVPAAGVRGTQILVAPADYLRATKANLGAIAKERE